MKSKKLVFYILLLIAAGILAYFFGYASYVLWLFVLLLFQFTLSREEVGVFLLLAGSGICGRMFASQSFNIIFTSGTLAIGLLLLLPNILDIIKRQHRSYFYLVLLLSFFFIEYCFGPQSPYAREKMAKLFVRSLLWMTCFLVYVNSGNISNRSLAVSFLLLAIFYLSQSFVLYDIHPTSLKNLSFFREQAEILGRNDLGTMVVNSHTLGYLAIFPMALWFSDNKVSLRNKDTLILFLLSLLIVVFSGTRQVLVSFIILLILRILIDSKTKRLSSLMLILLILISTNFILNNFGVDYFSTIVEGENASSKLHRDIYTPISIMQINPWFGVGFGAYPDYANIDYPHNIILELLCETGIVGTLVFFLIIGGFVFLNRNRKYFRMTTAHNSYFFLIFLLFFFRSFISGDMSDSMSGICALLAIVYREPDKKFKEALP